MYRNRRPWWNCVTSTRGSTFIEELKRIGHERGCVGMWVLTDEDNPAAMSLYRSTGGRWDGGSHVMFEYDLADE